MSRAFIQKRLPFKPTDIGGCQLWLDGVDPAGTGTPPSNGATVPTWTDKSGSGNSVTLTSSTYSFNSFTGKYGIYFNSNPSSAITLTPYMSFFVSSYWTATFPSNYRGLLGKTPNVFVCGQNDGAGNFMAGILNSTTNVYGSVADARTMVMTDVFYIPSTSFSLLVGCGDLSPTGNPWIGHIYEMIVFNTTLNKVQYQQVESYLAQKWGLQKNLPQGHPGTRGIVYPQTPLQNWVPWRYPSAFVPTSIGNCQLWLDASDTTTITIATGVSQWNDKSGNNRNVSQPTTANQPSYANNTITFNGSTYLTNLVSAGISAGNFTGYLVYKPTGAGGRALFVVDNNTNWIMIDTGQVAENSNGGGAYIATTISTTVPTIVAVTSATTYSLDGNAFSSISNGYSQGQSPTSINVGSGVSGGVLFSGSVYEVIVYSFVLSQPQQYQIQGYLAWKWGLQANLPANHPYKNSAPIGATNPGGVSRPANLPVPPITIYAGSRPPTYVTSGLLFYLDAGNATSYPGTGSTWTDLAGSGLTTTLFNTPTYSSANGGYLSFAPGSSQYGQTSASLASLSVWSVEVWHYYNNTNNGAWPAIVTEVFSNPYVNFALGAMTAATNNVLEVGYHNNGWYTTSTTYTLPSVGWYHIVGTYDGTNLKLYINNVLTQTAASSTASASSSAGIRFMRRWDSGDYWGGYLAIVRIYNRALSATEVTTNYAASKARFGLS